MTVAVTMGNTRARLSERKNDCYETPAVAVEALCDAERLPLCLWEPACGPGAIAKVLRARGHGVIASDLVDYGFSESQSGIDFLMEWQAPSGCEAIITNPPFKLADQFAAHALTLVPKVYLLVRLAFLESERRSAVLDSGQLARVLVFRNRLPVMHRLGWDGPRIESSTVPFAWFIWNRAHAGPTELRRISWEAAA